jgi:radical SAM protein with 4Fe4S-binding SPASM domain
VKKIQISIDGYDEKSNSKIRGPLAFEKALDTVNKLLANNFTVQIAVTPPFKEAIENDTRYIEFAKDLLVKHKDKNLNFRFSYSLIPGRTISEAKVKEMRETYYNAINHIGKAIYGEDDDVQGLVSNLKGHTIFNNCGYGGLNISSMGDVYFCSQISRVASYANIRSDCFAHIMELAERARDVSNVNNLAPCKECELKYICGGGCRADYFPEMCYMKEFSPDEVQAVPARQCSKEHKEKMYKLMIASNEDFFE